MSKVRMLFEAAKAAGLVSAAVTTGVGIMLRKKDQAEDLLMAQVSAGEHAKEILKRAGRFAEDPEMRKQEINIANAKAIKDFLLSQIFIDDNGNVFVGEESLVYASEFSSQYGMTLSKNFDGETIPLNKVGFTITKEVKNKKGESEIAFMRRLIMIELRQKDGSFKVNFQMK